MGWGLGFGGFGGSQGFNIEATMMTNIIPRGL